ncbi:hypothetical protein LENED_011147 [Lentinula edodes]|uniref:Uncharacterized protein n=1 Tax=Lentinula edodes TaxID=5353 RepID=A0A1Q3EP96_LENED|nr:hypothetical protein LENED_011147 [Lentinula edodes]
MHAGNNLARLYYLPDALRLTSIPMGWTNSLQIFHGDVMYILQPEIPEYMLPYVDNVNVRGPATHYELTDGSYETIPENPGICQVHASGLHSAARYSEDPLLYT